MMGLFKKKETHQHFYSKVPVESVKDLQRTEWGKRFLKQYSQMKIKLMEYEQAENQKKRDAEQIEERKKIEVSVLKKNEINQAKSKKREVIFKIDLKKGQTYPLHFTKYGKPWLKFYGVQFKSTEEGLPLWSLVVVDSKGKKYAINGSSEITPNSLFKHSLRIPEEINSGRVDTNIIFVKGKPAIETTKDYQERILQQIEGGDDNSPKVKVINMDELQRQEYEEKLADWEEKYGMLYTKAKELAKRVPGYQHKINDMETSNEVVSAHADLAESQLEAVQKKSNAILFNAAVSSSALQDMTFDKLLAERMGKKLWGKVEELQQNISKSLTQSEREAIAREIYEYMMSGAEMHKRVTTPPPARKEGQQSGS